MTLSDVSALDADQTRLVLTSGELKITGRLTNASNATLFGTVTLDGVELRCVHKPVAGERPLWDFPDGTLAYREVAAYEVSEATGWRIVPPTVLREGPWGPGMCQLWIDTSEDQPEGEEAGEDANLLALIPEDEVEKSEGWLPILSVGLEDGTAAVLAHRDDERLRRIAAFDAAVNNADRKGGHLLIAAADASHVYGIDHGITFAVEDKLRTLLWGFAEDPLGPEIRETLERAERDLAGGALAVRLGELLAPAEVAMTRERVQGLLRVDCFPGPGSRQRPVPWPPF